MAGMAPSARGFSTRAHRRLRAHAMRLARRRFVTAGARATRCFSATWFRWGLFVDVRQEAVAHPDHATLLDSRRRHMISICDQENGRSMAKIADLLTTPDVRFARDTVRPTVMHVDGEIREVKPDAAHEDGAHSHQHKRLARPDQP